MDARGKPAYDKRKRGAPDEAAQGRTSWDCCSDVLGLVLFLGAHTFTTQREARARAIASMGEGGYKIAYALVSAAGLALIVWGFAHYRATDWIPVWTPPKALKHLNTLLMLPAVILVAAAYIRAEGLDSAADLASGILVG